MHEPLHGIVHSVFNAAANIAFPYPDATTRASTPPLLDSHPYNDSGASYALILSLNAVSTPRMPNGIQLSSPAGSFPFSALRPGMPVIFGAYRLHIEAIDCSLDLSQSPHWNPHIQRPAQLDMVVMQRNYYRLQALLGEWEHGHRDNKVSVGQAPDILTLAREICGRGPGLTPGGDDILAGWMAAGWLLYGPEPGFVETCQRIVAISRRQTHLLSQCWLSYAAGGNVAEPIAALLDAMTRSGDAQLERALITVLAMGATSGYDVCQGVLLTSSIRIE
ncbi:MAG TPA: DUF2877 domain-containing protein [Ktedonobacteraceae bacterium]|jgi:hypothetical protein|nr:DUF2877 domain-containing protein [Ktedonobacteraceae bacterium]